MKLPKRIYVWDTNQFLSDGDISLNIEANGGQPTMEPGERMTAGVYVLDHTVRLRSEVIEEKL